MHKRGICCQNKRCWNVETWMYCSVRLSVCLSVMSRYDSPPRPMLLCESFFGWRWVRPVETFHRRVIYHAKFVSCGATSAAVEFPIRNFCTNAWVSKRIESINWLSSRMSFIEAIELFYTQTQSWKCRGRIDGGWIPQFMSADAHFWVKIGFKFQSLGKISNISAADPSSFRSIPTLHKPGL